MADTDAVAMLNAALDQARAEKGLTQRDVARELGYKGSVVLSHMASGRVPIPVDRAIAIAEVTGVEPRAFLLAVLEQRFPQIGFEDLLGITIERSDGVVARLEALAGKPLELLERDTLTVLEQVVTTNAPSRRWLSLDELVLMDRIRAAFPHLKKRALTKVELDGIERCLSRATDKPA